MSLADALLQQAWDLLDLDPRRPKQVNLRRAISGAYYALFHRLISDATYGVTGGATSGGATRDAVARWFTHGRMVATAKSFASSLGLKKGPVRNLLLDTTTASPTHRVPSDLVDVANAFVALQNARHEADYDLTAWYSRATARLLVGRSESAFHALQRLQHDPTYGLFLLLLLTGEEIARPRE